VHLYDAFGNDATATNNLTVVLSLNKGAFYTLGGSAVVA